jgi:adenosylmethionine-8-amino-7-oxononanoate aminotransferase
LFQVEFLEFPTAEKEEETIAQFTQLLNSGDVGAFIFEPLIQGAAGMRIYSAKILDALIRIAKEKNIICIADEVFTGFYRTGKFLATDALSIKPDIIALSKGITGGTMPMGVTVCTAEIYDAFKSDELIKAFLHGHSYTANPLSCAAANASFDLLMSEPCQQQIKMIDQSHRNFVHAIKTHPSVKKADSLGTILSIELASEGKTSYENNLRKLIYEYFLEQDILLRPLGNIIYIVPPYVITEMELQRIYKAIESFLNLLKGR